MAQARSTKVLKINDIPLIGVYDPVRYWGKFRLMAKKYFIEGQSFRNNLRKPPPTNVAIIIPMEVAVFLTKTEIINEIVPMTIDTNHPREYTRIKYCNSVTLITLETSKVPEAELKPVATGSLNPQLLKNKPEIKIENRAISRITIENMIRSAIYLLSNIFHRGTALVSSTFIVLAENSPHTLSPANRIISKGSNTDMDCSISLTENFAALGVIGFMLLSK